MMNLDLTTLVPTRTQRFLAALTALIVVGSAAAVLPVVGIEVGPLPPFLPAVLALVILSDAITAYLLWRQSLATGKASLAALGFAYALNGLLPIPYVLTFPSVFGDGGAFGGPQSGIATWTVWHGAFPLIVLIYLCVWARESTRLGRPFAQRLIWGLAILALLLTGIVSFVVSLGPVRLPTLIVGRSYTSLFQIVATAEAIVGAIAFVAVAARTRLRSVAHLWLSIALLAFVADIAITVIASRFSVAWYVARCQSLVAATVVLFALLGEAGRLNDLLASSENRLSAIVDGVADALITIDDERRILTCNSATHQLFGAPNGLVGHQIETLVPKFVEIDPRLGERERTTFGRRIDGSTFPLEISRTVLPGRKFDGGRTILIARDITVRHRDQKALALARDRAIAAAKAKAEFLATMSHEIRTPLNAIIGMSELLLGTAMTDEQRDYAQTAQNSAEALLTVINEILDFSKLEAGGITLESLPFSPVTTVESAADIVAAQARKKGLALQAFSAPDIPPVVWGDANRLRQVLLNLLSNAIKFTAQGSIEIRVDVVESDPHFARLQFSVKDTGIGIAPEAQTRLFTAFTQADGSTSRKYGGTGLGLSISKQLVDLMGGTISIESPPEGGSRFSFTVGFERGSETARNLVEVRVLDGMRVLVADDDVASRSILAQYVSSWGAAAFTAPDGERALEMLHSALRNATPFDAALIDYVMPGETGITLGKLLRNDPAFGNLRLILITAYDEASRGTEALAVGFNAVLRKPIRQSTLYEVLTAGHAVREEILPQPIQPLGGSGGLVLLVDDNSTNQKIACRQLERLGLEAHVASSGEEAIAATSQCAYALVLMDCQMPGIDGFEATRQIRIRQMSTGVRVPIVAMTANAMEGDREMCLAAGMDDYISKPVRADTLRAVIERFIAPAASFKS